MKYNYHDKNARSEFDSVSIDETVKGVQTENYVHYSPISLNVQAGGRPRPERTCLYLNINLHSNLLLKAGVFF